MIAAVTDLSRLSKDWVNYPTREKYSLTDSILDVSSFGSLVILKEMQNVITTMRNTLASRGAFFHVPHKMFQWDVHAFQIRREMKDTTYVDVLEYKPEMELRKTKLDVDLDNIIQILGAALSDVVVSRKFDGLMAKLGNSRKYAEIHNNILEEYSNNSREHKLLLQRRNMFQMRENNMQITCSMEVNKAFDNCIDTIIVYEPIVGRYTINHMHGQLEDLQSKIDKKENDLQKDINGVKRKLDLENVGFQNSQYVQSEVIQSYTDRINDMSAKYDLDFEKIELEVNVKLAAIKSVQSKFAECVEKLAFYREQLRLHEEEELEKIRLQEEAEAAAAAAAELELLQKPKKASKAKKNQEKKK